MGILSTKCILPDAQNEEKEGEIKGEWGKGGEEDITDMSSVKSDEMILV